MSEDYMTEEDAKALFIEDFLRKYRLGWPNCGVEIHEEVWKDKDCSFVVNSKKEWITENGIDLTQYPWFEWLKELHQKGLVTCKSELGVGKELWWSAATPHEIATFIMRKKNGIHNR